MNYELYHHGILGMKWGIRRYQNKDGSLTPEGRRRIANRQEDINRAISKFKNADTVKKQARAQKKIYRLVNKYSRLVNEIAYNRMTDAEVIEILRNYKFNDSLPSIVTSNNIAAGKKEIKKTRVGLLGMGPVSAAVRGDAEYMDNFARVSRGAKEGVLAATAAVGLMSAIKALKKKADGDGK